MLSGTARVPMGRFAIGRGKAAIGYRQFVN